jgi:hypothetical protein
MSAKHQAILASGKADPDFAAAQSGLRLLVIASEAKQSSAAPPF